MLEGARRVGVEGWEETPRSYVRLGLGVVGRDKSRGDEGVGGTGYCLEPNDAATSQGRTPVLMNPSQVL